ncbi:MAG: hypothetical protein NTY32_10765 [Bacteroidia bacterium]|nr:hypothetical protein [Bacteroidia bacterium]
MKSIKQELITILFLLFILSSNAQNNRQILNLTGDGWRVWLDSTAVWKTDSLYLPQQFDCAKLPINTPSCGWSELFTSKGIVAKIPACFEELFGQGNPSWRYHGVGWFAKEIDIPAEWKNKTIRMYVGMYRQRLEIYVNEKLVGYDVIAETPYSCDISLYIRAGKKNRIAFRITNPGGQRGWSDEHHTTWDSKYVLIPGHDFGGIAGDVSLIATDPIFISDIFVKNTLPANANNIELQLSIVNKEHSQRTLNVVADIIPYSNGKSIYSTSWTVTVTPDSETLFRKNATVPEAKRWDVDNPNLYYCRMSISDIQASDQQEVRFGFRVFEAKTNQKGEHNYYLNGKRIRIRSAIDWNFYWQTGFYATPEMARKSVENAKNIGLNCLSMHRRIGDPLMLKYADELGLCIYEEPGGMPAIDELLPPAWVLTSPKERTYFPVNVIIEKFDRMMRRDRNSPSVMIWNIANEQNAFGITHKRIFENALKIDNSRMITNQSGGQFGGESGLVPHLRPYQNKLRLDYIDDHTIEAESRFQEKDLKSHQTNNDSCIIHWGEVRCYTGPDNFYLLANPSNTVGYDYKSWSALGEKTATYFVQNDFKNHPFIKSPADLSVQAGRGLMYTDGRLGQAMMLNNSADGYAINGWSGADLSLGDNFLAWYSAICDEGRNLKGPAADYSYWIRPLQIAITRQNGKYFEPNQSAVFKLSLINENKLTAGEYTLQLKIKDGSGQFTDYQLKKTIAVLGGDVYTQSLIDSLSVSLSKNWKAGFITLEAQLLQNGREVANGAEQILLKNASSFSKDIAGKKIVVYQWQSANEVLAEAKASIGLFSSQTQKPDVILAAGLPDSKTIDQMLKCVKDGATLVLKFDQYWAEQLYKKKILKEPVTYWGGTQKPYWNGNGWGYLEQFMGNQANQGVSCISTNSWEVPTDPVGFEPFVSNYSQKSYGAFFWRPDRLLTLAGSITLGKGEILLAPSYPVDDKNAFNDLLFFEMIK